MKPSPAVFVIAAIYIAVGIAGFVTHFPRRSHPEDVPIEVTEMLAIHSRRFAVEVITPSMPGSGGGPASLLTFAHDCERASEAGIHRS